MVGTGAPGGREARSAGMALARRLFAVHEHSERTGVPVAEVLGAVEAEKGRQGGVGGGVDRQTRRELLVGVGGLAGGAVLVGESRGGSGAGCSGAGETADCDRWCGPGGASVRAHAVDAGSGQPGRVDGI